MNSIGLDQFLLFIGIAFTSYFFSRLLVRGLVRSGLPTRAYLRYIYPKRVATAYNKGDAGFAERQVYQTYLAQLTAAKETDRELAVQYLAQLPASQALIDRLMAVLPQQTKKSLQLRMVQLLRTALLEVQPDSLAAKDNFESGLPQWSRAITIWLAIVIVVTLRWSWLMQLNAVFFSLTTLVLLGGLLLPVTWVVSDRQMFVRVAGVLIGLMLAGLWAFSDYTHAGVDSTALVSLEQYNLGSARVQIAYPRWMTINDVGKCNDEILITVFGSVNPVVNPIEVSLLYSHADLFVGDQKCQVVVPSLNVVTTDLAGLPNEFYVKLPRREVLAKQQITITPQFRDSKNNGPLIPARELDFTIQLEDPFWEVIRTIGRILFGTTSISSFLVALYAWSRRKSANPALS
jgi:hypothetical protein